MPVQVKLLDEVVVSDGQEDAGATRHTEQRKVHEQLAADGAPADHKITIARARKT